MARFVNRSVRQSWLSVYSGLGCCSYQTVIHRRKAGGDWCFMADARRGFARYLLHKFADFVQNEVRPATYTCVCLYLRPLPICRREPRCFSGDGMG